MNSIETSTDNQKLDKAYVEAALALRKAGENQGALRLVKKAIAINKNDVDAQVLAGLICQEIKVVEKAEQYFRKALSINRKNPDALKSLGLFLLSLDRIDEALDLLSEYLHQDHWDDQFILGKISSITVNIQFPQLITDLLKEAWERTLSSRIGLLYGRNLRHKGEYKLAIEVLRLISRRDSYPDILNELAINLVSDNQIDAAIPIYIKTIKKSESWFHERYTDYLDDISDPEDGYSTYEVPYYIRSIYSSNIADCYLKTEKVEDALETAKDAVLLNEYNISGQELYIRALIKLERFDEAVIAAKKALDLEWENSVEESKLSALLLLEAEAEKKAGDTAVAIQTLETGIQRFPHEILLYFEISKLLNETDKPDEAIQFLEQVFDELLTTNQSFEHQFEIVLNITIYYLLIWNNVSPEQALDKFKRVIRISPIWCFFYLYARLNYLLDNSDEVEEQVPQMAEQLYAAFPDQPMIIQLLCNVRIYQNRLDLASEILDNILKNPISDEHRLLFLNNLGYIKLHQGSFDSAEIYLKQALELPKTNTYSLFTAGIGIAFFLDGVIRSGFWVEKRPSLELFMLPIDLASVVVTCNLITLALAKGDVDKATTYWLEIYLENSADPTKVSYVLVNLAGLFLARFRKEVLTARYFHKKLKESEEINDIYFPEDELRSLFPEFIQWLIPDD